MPPRPHWAGVRTVIWQWFHANTFAPTWLPARWRHPATGYVLAALLQIMAAIFTRLLIGFFSTYSFPGMVEVLIVALMALSFGAGPALFATFLGVALEELVVLPVRIGEGQFNLVDLLEIALFLAVGVSISLVASASEGSRLRALKEQAEAQERELTVTRQTQENMDEFLAIASHDLRAPLSTAVGFIQIAARRCERLAEMAQCEKPDLARLVENVRGSVGDARLSVERLSRLVTTLFDTSRARSGKLELNLTQCDLAALTRDQVGAVRVSVPQRTICMQVSPTDPVWVVADVDRIGQVITNYLTNALKYSPDDQAVDVWVTVTDDWARIAVEDRGPGIAPNELGHIWQPFHRVAGVAAQRGANSGLGMGLYISKTIIELHGGQVGVESAVGRGSTFWFELPLAQQTI